MTCELFDEDLKLMGFSNRLRCVYERRCRFANSTNINKFEISESCQALADIKGEEAATVEDVEQDMALKSLISEKWLN